MTKQQVEVITSVQRRRWWSLGEKQRIVAVALEPGVVASEIAREAGIHASRQFRWRQELCRRTSPPAVFNPVAIAPEPTVAALSAPEAPLERAGTVEIEFATGGRMRIVALLTRLPIPRFRLGGQVVLLNSATSWADA